MKRYNPTKHIKEEKKVLKEGLRGNFYLQKIAIETSYKKIVFKTDIQKYFEHLPFVTSAELTPVIRGINLDAWRMIFFYKEKIDSVTQQDIANEVLSMYKTGEIKIVNSGPNSFEVDILV